MDESILPLWRTVSQQLVKEIDEGRLVPGKRLPASRDLANQLGVNRNTLLRAIADLQSKGLLRTEKGRGGTFVAENAISYRLGARTRFEENILQLNYAPIRKILAVRDLPATPSIAKELNLETEATVTLVSLLGQASHIPLNFGHHYFATERVPGISDAFHELGISSTVIPTIAAALYLVGILDFQRGEIRVHTRPASKVEARTLKIPNSEHVLEVEAVNINADKEVLMYSQTAFPGSRVKITFDPVG